jgi:DNA-binding NtrC family response regulator
MTPDPDPSEESRVVLFTPTGRDSTLIADTLSAAGISCHACRSISEVVERIDAGCATLLLAEEAVNADSVKCLARALDAQPTWSDLPVIVLTSTGEQSLVTDYKLKMLAPLGNISLVERPVRPSTLVSIIRSALRARDRQYQFREQAKALQNSTRIFSALRASHLTICRSLCA